MQTFPWVATATRHPALNVLTPNLGDKEKFYAWFTAEFREGDKVWLTIERPHKTRTHRQFRYLFSCVYPYIAKEWGDCPLDVVDGVMKKRHLTVNVDSPLEYTKNKTDLNRAELAQFIDNVRCDAANMGIVTKDPEEYK
jgi:hypothetical protein